jgi:hypothetical protein
MAIRVSDWEALPLTPAQQSYAADDAAASLQCYQVISIKLCAGCLSPVLLCPILHRNTYTHTHTHTHLHTHMGAGILFRTSLRLMQCNAEHDPRRDVR